MPALKANIGAFYRVTYCWHLVLSLIRAELHLKVNAQPNLPAWFPKLVPAGWPEEWRWASQAGGAVTGDWDAHSPPHQVQSQLVQNEEGWGTLPPTHHSHRNAVWMASAIFICWQILLHSFSVNTGISEAGFVSHPIVPVRPCFCISRPLRTSWSRRDKKRGSQTGHTGCTMLASPSSSWELPHLE